MSTESQVDISLKRLPTDDFISAYDNGRGDLLNQYEEEQHHPHHPHHPGHPGHPQQQPHHPGHPQQHPHHNAGMENDSPPSFAAGGGGPGSKRWNASKKEFTFNFAFNVNNGGEPSEVMVNEQDLKELFVENASIDPDMVSRDLKKAVVIETKVTGSTLSKNANYALKLFDARGRPMFETHGFKSSEDGVWRKFGVPLYTSSKVLMSASDHIDRDLTLYGAMSMDDLTSNTAPLSYPGVNGERDTNFMFVPKEPNGAYFIWALEYENQAVAKGSLMGDPQFSDPQRTDYFRLPTFMYDSVVNAYAKKLTQDVKFYDLSKIQAVLTPLSNRREGPRGAPQFENIAIEFCAYLAPEEGLQKFSRGGGGAAYGEAREDVADFSETDYSQLVQRFAGNGMR